MSDLSFVVRHRKFLKDWSKVLILCDTFEDAKIAVVEIINSSLDIAEAEIYDPLTQRTSNVSPKYSDNIRQELSVEEVR